LWAKHSNLLKISTISS